jgi:photosystem II stability/assembly factor-like uncharacterized protein
VKTRTLIALFALLFVLNIHSIAQTLKNDFIFESKYGNSSDLNLPEWVRAMYASRPNLEEVKNLYEDYYSSHAFEKNNHTQYFKRWVKEAQRFVNDSGFVVFPDALTKESIQNDYLQTVADYRNSRFGPGSEWTCIGPFDFDKDATGRSHAPGSAHVYTVEKSASNPNVLFAGTATAGIYKTMDHGQNWTLLSKDLPINTCRAVEIQFDNPDIVYAGGNGKIYKTTDGGITWLPTGQSSFTSVNHSVYSIVMMPGNSNKLFASTSYGLYLTTDAGANWNQLVSAPGSGEYFGDIEIHPTDTNIIYAIYNAFIVGGNNQLTKFYKSTDAGNTFTALASWPSNTTTIAGSSHQERAEIAVTPAAPDRIYAILTGAANGGEGLYGFFRSDDAGATWTHYCCGTGPGGLASTSNVNVMGYATDGTDDGGQYYYDLAIDADKVNPDKVHVAGIMQWISTDAGASFTCVNSWSNPSNAKYVHADIHDIRIYGNEVWIACDGGIFLSEDSGLTSFNRRQYGIAGTDFWGFGAGFKDGNVMLGGTYHNSHLLKNNNVYLNGWISYTGSADGYRGFVNPGNNKWVYNDSRKDLLPPTRTDAFVNYPFGRIPNASYFLGYSCPLVWHPACYTTVFSGKDSALWKSTDDGISWTAIGAFGTGDITDLEIAFDNPLKIYLVFTPTTGQRKIWKTIDGGINWIDVTAPSSVIGANTARQLDITIDEHNSEIIWMAILSSASSTNNNKVFKSTDGGTTWFNYSSAILNNHTMQSIVHQRGTDGGVYVGTTQAVFYRNNTMSDWELYNNGLPVTTSCFKLVPWYKEGKIRNAGDRSVWEAALYEIGAPVAQLTVDKLSSGCARDTFYFADHSSQYGTNATWSWQINPAPAYMSANNTEYVKVVFGNSGSYSVSLAIGDSMGTDSIGYNNFITVSNECDADTIPGNALEINANGQYASTLQPLNLNSNTVTMSAWIKPSLDQPNWAGVIFFRGGSTTSGLNFTDNTNQLGYHWDGGFWGWAGGPTVALNEWSHVALVIDGTSAIIYLNGVPYTNSGNHLLQAFDTPMILGNDPNSSGRTFKGLIDEVCVYNRALTQSEIRELMHLTKVPQNDTSLASYLQFNENSGQAYDRTGINHAAIAGGATRIISSGPFGGGNSASQNITTPGNYAFGNTGLSMAFAPSSNVPDGEVWATRINLQPDVVPAHPDSTAKAYWVVQNFGNNAQFNPLQNIKFDGLGYNVVQCADHQLYQRAANADGNTWSAPIDSGDLCAGTFPNNSCEFNQGNNIINPGQFTVGVAPQSPTAALMLSFDAKLYLGNQAKLTWKSGNENDVKMFVAERKNKSGIFEGIDTVYNHQMTATGSFYSKIDEQPFSGVNEYRIRQINKNNSSGFSEIRKVLIGSLPANIVIGPNPAEENSEINIYTSERNLQVEIFDVHGRVIHAQTMKTGNTSISLEGIAKGSYNIRFKNESGMWLQKIIIR